MEILFLSIIQGFKAIGPKQRHETPLIVSQSGLNICENRENRVCRSLQEIRHHSSVNFEHKHKNSVIQGKFYSLRLTFYSFFYHSRFTIR